MTSMTPADAIVVGGIDSYKGLHACSTPTSSRPPGPATERCCAG
jgi:hypothetical protein